MEKSNGGKVWKTEQYWFSFIIILQLHEVSINCGQSYGDANIFHYSFRYVEGELVCPKIRLASPIAAYENTLEVQTLAQLEEIISDPDEMRMQALLVRERILGPAHPDTSYYIRYRGAVYADMGHFERCITLWMYALDMQQKMLEPLSPMTQSSLLSFAELFSYMMSEGRARGGGMGGGIANNNNQNDQQAPPPPPAPPVAPSNNRGGRQGHNGPNGQPVQQGPNAPNHSSSSPPNHPPVNFCDIMTVFEKAVSEVRVGQETLGKNPTVDRDVTYFNRTLIIILHLVCLLTKLLPHLSDDEQFKVKKSVYEFLKIGARGRNGCTPLHLACSRDSSAVGRYPICQFPSVEVISLLIECGADPNVKDTSIDRNNALHVTANGKPSKPAVVKALLDGGAHLDAINKNNKTFAQLLKGQQVHEVVNVVQHTTLQCLAAKTIKKYNIPYKETLSKQVAKFVDIH